MHFTNLSAMPSLCGLRIGVVIFRSRLVQNNLLTAVLSSEATVRRTRSKSKATAGQFNLLEPLTNTCSCEFKNTGNRGNNGNSPLNRGFQALPMPGFCCHRFFTGNSDNQKQCSTGSLILKLMCVLPVVATFFIGWQRL
jgi:hypothetical protein